MFDFLKGKLRGDNPTVGERFKRIFRQPKFFEPETIEEKFNNSKDVVDFIKKI